MEQHEEKKDAMGSITDGTYIVEERLWQLDGLMKAEASSAMYICGELTGRRLKT